MLNRAFFFHTIRAQATTITFSIILFINIHKFISIVCTHNDR